MSQRLNRKQACSENTKPARLAAAALAVCFPSLGQWDRESCGPNETSFLVFKILISGFVVFKLLKENTSWKSEQRDYKFK